MAYLTKTRQINPQKVKDYTYSLDRKLDNIYEVKELKRNLEEQYTDAYGRAMRNLFNFLEYQEIEEFNDISLDKWRKAIKLKRSGIREIYVSDRELQKAYQNIDKEYMALFKLLAFSGMRLSQVIQGIKNIGNVIIKGKVARIPISFLSKGNKKGFFIYFPLEFLEELPELNPSYWYDTYLRNVRHKRVSASTIRKWNFNFMIENDVPESIADFIQGRSSITVGSAHYLNKARQADREYKRIKDKLLELF